MTSFTFPVNIQTMVIRQQPNTEIYYPKIIGMKNEHVQRAINTKIHQAVEKLFQKQFHEQQKNSFEQMIGIYEIKTNQRNVLSLTLSNYAIARHAANGLTLMSSLTFDLETGKNIELKDLFKRESDYVTVLSDIVKKQIKMRDIPTFESFNGISPNQTFYIADKCLVIYFQAIEFTPHSFGIPVFPISVFELEDIVKDGGALERMAAST